MHLRFLGWVLELRHHPPSPIPLQSPSHPLSAPRQHPQSHHPYPESLVPYSPLTRNPTTWIKKRRYRPRVSNTTIVHHNQTQSYNYLVQLHKTPFPLTIHGLILFQFINQHCLMNQPSAWLTKTLRQHSTP